MGSTKIIGYVLAILGLAVIALSNSIVKLPFLANNAKGLLYVAMTGVVLIAVGIALSLTSSSSNSIKQAAEEVPIYEGEGKKRKIVGYKKEAKR
jgi:hypothetical protein